MTLDDILLEAALARRERLEAAQDTVEAARGDFNRAIRHLHVAGGSMREIAEALGLSHQRVHQIVEAGQPAQVKEDAMPDDQELVCHFCDRDKDHVPTLIAGPGLYICGDCVERVRRAGDAGGAQGDLAVQACGCRFCGKQKVDWVVQRQAEVDPPVTMCCECCVLCEQILA